jgi:hypothetical protein
MYLAHLIAQATLLCDGLPPGLSLTGVPASVLATFPLPPPGSVPVSVAPVVSALWMPIAHVMHLLEAVPGAAVGTVLGGVADVVPDALSMPRVLASVKPLPQVIEGLKDWVMGILFAVASLCMAVAGLRYVGSNGDPALVEQAKGNFKAGLVGYALAVLSPVFLQILQDILGA